MGMKGAIRHLTTFGGGKIPSAPRADNPRYAVERHAVHTAVCS